MVSLHVWHVSAEFHWLLWANGSELKYSTWYPLWSLVCRFYVSSPVEIRQSGWPEMLFEGFWYNSKWRKIQDDANYVKSMNSTWSRDSNVPSFVKFRPRAPKLWAKMHFSFLLLIAPPLGQSAPEFLGLLKTRTRVCVGSLRSKPQMVAEIWPHVLVSMSALSLIGCYGQTEAN